MKQTQIKSFLLSESQSVQFLNQSFDTQTQTHYIQRIRKLELQNTMLLTFQSYIEAALEQRQNEKPFQEILNNINSFTIPDLLLEKHDYLACNQILILEKKEIRQEILAIIKEIEQELQNKKHSNSHNDPPQEITKHCLAIIQTLEDHCGDPYITQLSQTLHQCIKGVKVLQNKSSQLKYQTPRFSGNGGEDTIDFIALMDCIHQIIKSLVNNPQKSIEESDEDNNLRQEIFTLTETIKQLRFENEHLKQKARHRKLSQKVQLIQRGKDEKDLLTPIALVQGLNKHLERNTVTDLVPIAQQVAQITNLLEKTYKLIYQDIDVATADSRHCSIGIQCKIVKLRVQAAATIFSCNPIDGTAISKKQQSVSMKPIRTNLHINPSSTLFRTKIYAIRRQNLSQTSNIGVFSYQASQMGDEVIPLVAKDKLHRQIASLERKLLQATSFHDQIQAKNKNLQEIIEAIQQSQIQRILKLQCYNEVVSQNVRVTKVQTNKKLQIKAKVQCISLKLTNPKKPKRLELANSVIKLNIAPLPICYKRLLEQQTFQMQALQSQIKLVNTEQISIQKQQLGKPQVKYHQAQQYTKSSSKQTFKQLEQSTIQLYHDGMDGLMRVSILSSMKSLAYKQIVTYLSFGTFGSLQPNASVGTPIFEMQDGKLSLYILIQPSAFDNQLNIHSEGQDPDQVNEFWLDLALSLGDVVLLINAGPTAATDYIIEEFVRQHKLAQLHYRLFVVCIDCEPIQPQSTALISFEATNDSLGNILAQLQFPQFEQRDFIETFQQFLRGHQYLSGAYECNRDAKGWNFISDEPPMIKWPRPWLMTRQFPYLIAQSFEDLTYTLTVTSLEENLIGGKCSVLLYTQAASFIQVTVATQARSTTFNVQVPLNLDCDSKIEELKHGSRFTVKFNID